MNKPFFILIFIFSGSSIYSQIQLDWVSRHNVDTIHYPGQRVTLKLVTTTGVDSSILVNETVIFSNTNIKHIGQCDYYRTFKDSILYKVEIKTKGKSGYLNLQNYFNQIAAINLTNNINKNSILTAISTYYNRLTQIIFFTDKNHKNSTLILALTDIGSN